jgi:hypothetical protein
MMCHYVVQDCVLNKYIYIFRKFLYPLGLDSNHGEREEC